MRYSTAIVSALFAAGAYAVPVQQKREADAVTVLETDIVTQYAATTQIVTEGAAAPTTSAAPVVTTAPVQVQEAAPTPNNVVTVYESAWTKSWSWEESAPASSVAASTVAAAPTTTQAAAPTTTQAPASTSAAPAATSSASYASGSFEDSCLSTHNKYRAIH
jgi:hypothetical protein